jgi:hypothetical protein
MALESVISKTGYLSFITPNTWELIDSAKLFRKKLLATNYKLCQLIQHQNKVFEEATVDCDTTIIVKSNKNDNVLVRFKNTSVIIDEHLISQKILSNQEYLNPFLTEKDYALKDKILSQSVFVKDTLTIKNGVKPYEKGKGKPPQTDEIMREKPYTSKIKKDDSFSPLIGGSSFHRYKLLWDDDYWIQYGEWLAAPREKEIFDAKEKLIFRQTSDSIIGTLIGKGFVMRDNTHVILNKDNSGYNLKYVLACLNSNLSNYFYWTINPEKGEAMAQVKVFHLGLLPLKQLSNDGQKPFVEIVDQILEQKTKNPDASTMELEHKIDALVYKLYGLSEEEIMVVEGRK